MPDAKTQNATEMLGKCEVSFPSQRKTSQCNKGYSSLCRGLLSCKLSEEVGVGGEHM